MAGRMSVGDVVMVHGLIFQLTVPLGILGTMYNQVRVATTDMNALDKLLIMQPAVASKPDAPPLLLTAGRIAFDIPNPNPPLTLTPTPTLTLTLTLTAPSDCGQDRVRHS